MDLIKLATDTVSMTKTELAAVTTVSGIAIVFGMLLLLVIMIAVFGLFGGRANKPAKVKETKKEVKKETKNKVKATAAVAPTYDNDEEIIAVISAAVAMMYEGTGKTAVVRSIRPASASRSAWAEAGRRNNVRAF